MTGRIWAVAAFGSLFLLLHCGGTVEVVPGAGGASNAGSAGRGHGGRSGQAGNAGSVSPVAGTGAEPVDAGFDVYVDPGCPDVGAPVEVHACDAYSEDSGCPPGQGCYPFVQHPLGDGCGVQRFGTECHAAGTGRQGDACGGPDALGCASGYECVVGSQAGTICVQLCPINQPNTCPPGLICTSLDVEGFGVCS